MKRIEVIGNIGKDAVIKDFNDKKAINFNIAENEYYTDKDGNKIEKTSWFNCTLWKSESQSIKIAEYLKKGVKVFIEGTPKADSYITDKGESVAFINIQVKNIELLSKVEN